MAVNTGITSWVILNQVQGSCALSFLSGHHRTGFYPHWVSGTQIQQRQALASSPPRSLAGSLALGECQALSHHALFSCWGPGIWKMLEGEGQCSAEEDQTGIAKVLTFLIPPPHPRHPLLLCLSHICSHHHNKIPLYHIFQSVREQRVSELYCTLHTPNVAGSASGLRAFQDNTGGSSLGTQSAVSKERTVLSSLVFRFDVSITWDGRISQGTCQKHKGFLSFPGIL